MLSFVSVGVNRKGNPVPHTLGTIIKILLYQYPFHQFIG